MTYLDAQQFLIDVSKNWNQPEERVADFVKWQHAASPEELMALNEWHEEFLTNNINRLSSNPAMLLKNQGWLAKKTAATPKGKVVSLQKRNRWIWNAAAVFFVLLLAAAVWKYQARNGNHNNISQAAKAIKPGCNKAVLTLADGRQIVLDSTGKHSITGPNGVQMIILDSGLLSYKGVNAVAPTFNTLTTPRGGQFQVILPDGSHVWLNSASSLRYPTAFSGNKREVALTGEGYFEITPNPLKPFVVSANNRVLVNVLGTGFNVMAYNDEDAIKTTLVHGAVNVEANGVKQHIVPGQQASLYNGQSTFNISQPDMAEVLGWKEGEFRFTKTSVQSIMKQVSRWYDVDVSYEGDLSNVSLSGVLSRQENAEQLLDILQLTKKIRFNIVGQKIVVMPYR